VALDFVFERFLKKAERVEILDFDFGAEFAGAARANADVGVTTERAFLHVDVADARVKHDLAKRGEIGVGLFGRANVGLGDDFDERRAAAVVINVSLGGGLREAFVKIFRGVFFEVKTGDADALAGACRGRPAGDFDIKVAVFSERQFVLRNLVALGEVGIEIVLAGEARALVHGAVERERGAHGHFDGALIENGKCAGEAEADGANVGVRRIAEARRAAAENLRFGEELNVDLEANDSLVFRQGFWRDEHGLWSGFRHKETNIIASARQGSGDALAVLGVSADGIAGGHVRFGGNSSRENQRTSRVLAGSRFIASPERIWPR
jgi:hypothetical protein